MLGPAVHHCRQRKRPAEAVRPSPVPVVRHRLNIMLYLPRPPLARTKTAAECTGNDDPQAPPAQCPLRVCCLSSLKA
eukprot:2955272-Rhodomonas_salina.2